VDVERRDVAAAPALVEERERRSRMYGNGNYEWGGRLARYVPGITEPSG